ncbi:lysophosphatidylcholine acyltransferase 2-like isoform X2 [Ruditapes philippinarum]|uniref:lysophosphatidylcholine acyltransferase 2-like isoform X2 n=1 Tax=Ruditapes philippinarum TaxID=129788 RepID=UPI00295ACF75|nr:lysophosphatidylcholine acyltransferase 2-like isoform X2 [Ruditapes philippinarum]
MKREIPRQQSLIVPEIQNPFVHKVHLGYLDMIQVAFMSVTIAPLRLLLVGISLLLAWPLAALAVSFRSKEEQNQPLSGWRNYLLRPIISFLSRCVFFAGGFHHVSVKGVRAPPTEAAVLVTAPHSSYFDALPVVFLDLTSVVAKAGIASAPIFGTLLKFTQPVLVKREDPNSRQNTVKEIQNRAQAGGWPQILIFPEGTCTNRSCLISFKLGAFHPGVPVQPVCLRYPNRLDTVTWTWEGPGVFTLLWLTLCQFNTRLEIEYLPVYTPSEEEKADPKLFANNVRKVMAEALGVPVTDHTYDDCRLMMKARKLNLPMESGLVEFQKLHKKLGISVDDMHTLLEKFSSIDLQGKGVITVSEFSKYLQVPESQSLKDVFAMYDRDGSGSIDFREYVIGLSLISAPVNTDSTISLAFQLFDSSKQGYISEEDLSHILYNSFAMLDVDVAELFKQIDADEDGKITYGEFKAFAEKRPEYAAVFMAYQELKKDDTNGNATTETEGHVKSE